ncbi:hypothetical protein [Streptomyces sp. NBC_01022]|uniref:hypothetical protein n=1 Tax=Streptomyces sp. NBC_01022 TaxID=2903723 RepID=UPI002DDC58CA|nr:hypothetical protein [Streptomyces sp. NBC_01022]WRZ82605.1 hypothetical protein OG316_21270 [Streptomyces sp. NBC_01022]
MRTATAALTTALAAILIAGCSTEIEATNPKYGLKFAASGCESLVSDDTLFKSTDPAAVSGYAEEHRMASIATRHAAELDPRWVPLADAVDALAAALDQAAKGAPGAVQDPAAVEAASRIRTDCPVAIQESAAAGD